MTRRMVILAATVTTGLPKSSGSLIQVDHTAKMRKRLLIICVIVTVTILGLVPCVFLGIRNHRLLQGKTESQWIKSINYNGDSNETDRWRALGPLGLQTLVKALGEGNGPVESQYRQIWPKLPPAFRSFLPTPPNSYPTRMCAASMLNRLGLHATNAFPALIRALRKEKMEGVRELIIACFNFEKGFLKDMNKEKAALLPELLISVQSPEWAARNNAVLALGSYSGKTEAVAVTPILIKALHDPAVNVRMAALLALHEISPRAVAAPVVMQVAIAISVDQNDQVAYNAIRLLGEMGNEAAPAVPVLIECARSTNRLVSQTAVRALMKIDPQAAAKAGMK